MKAILISSPINIKDEVSIIIRLFELGLEYFHLRKPGMDYIAFNNILKKIPEKYHKNIIIHSHYQLTNKYGLKGIHLPESIRKDFANKFNLFQNNIINSTSYHNLNDLLDYNNLYNYVFLSPVFDSISKTNYFSTFDLEDISLTLTKTQYKVVALGGIDLSNVKIIKNIGFYGIALLGSVWMANEPIKKFNEIKNEADSI